MRQKVKTVQMKFQLKHNANTINCRQVKFK